MIIYTLFFIFLVYSAYIVDYKGNRRNKHLLYAIEWLFFVLIIGFQWRMGSDNIYYEEMYKDIPPLGQLSSYEFIIGGKRGPLWILFCSALRSFNDSFVLFHFVHSIIINTVVLYFFHRYTKYCFTATLIFFLSFQYFFFNIELQRESLAVMCFLFGIGYLEKKSYVKYYICAVVAFLFHSSAVFCFVIPLLLFFSEKSKTISGSILRIILLTFIAMISLEQFYNSVFVNDVINNIAEQANNYHSVKINASTVLIYSLFNIIPVIIVLFFYFRYPSRINHTLVNLSLIMILVYFGYALNLAITRILTYLILPFYVCVADMLHIKDKRYRLLVIVCIIFMTISKIFEMQTIHESPYGHDWRLYELYIPYRSIFD